MPKPWVPDTVLITPSAAATPGGARMAERVLALGAKLVRLPADRLTGLPQAYRDAKRTMAIVNASPSRRRLQPIPPSADWRFDLAEGCPAHCSYCYLAGSLAGPPIIRAYANLPDILAELPPAMGQGQITSKSERADEGTTFECSCYTDPLAIEHITGHLAECITWFGQCSQPAQLRFTTKFDAVQSLLPLAHHGRTRVRFSVNAPEATRFEGGAPRIPARLAAMRAMAEAGYPIGLTVAPILRLPDWAAAYDRLFAMIAEALDGSGATDVTAELITHRFTEKSKQILYSWYPGSDLDMREDERSKKFTKFGSKKYVFTSEQMTEMREAFNEMLKHRLPFVKYLYWT